MQRRGAARSRLALAALTLATGLAAPAWAAVPGPAAARCQRVIARAAERCVATTVAVRRACVEAQLDAGLCDEPTTTAAVDAARQRAAAAVDAACTTADLDTLGLGTPAAAAAAVSAGCEQAERAVVEAAYFPALTSGSVAAVAGAVRACLVAAADAGARLTRHAARARQRVVDRLAARALDAAARAALLDAAERSIEHAGTRLAARIVRVCPPASFTALYGREPAVWLDGLGAQAACLTAATAGGDLVACPSPTCGNGIAEAAEECDHGTPTPTCSAGCTINTCPVYPSTLALIQTLVFDRQGCVTDLCHGEAARGGLDLRPAQAHAQLVDVAAEIDPTFRRVVPFDEAASLLYLKLTAKSRGVPSPAELPGAPMPPGTGVLSDAELDALRDWIRGGAPADGIVPGVAALLDTCEPTPEGG